MPLLLPGSMGSSCAGELLFLLLLVKLVAAISQAMLSVNVSWPIAAFAFAIKQQQQQQWQQKHVQQMTLKEAREYWIPVACCMLQGEWRVGVALHSWMTVSIKLKLISIRYAHEKLTQYSMWQWEGDKFQLDSIKSCSIFITYFNFNIEWKLKLSVLNWNVQKCTKYESQQTHQSILLIQSNWIPFCSLFINFNMERMLMLMSTGWGGEVYLYIQSAQQSVCLSRVFNQARTDSCSHNKCNNHIESQTEPRESINRGLSTLYYNM